MSSSVCYLSEPLFPHVWKRKNNNIYLIKLCRWNYCMSKASCLTDDSVRYILVFIINVGYHLRLPVDCLDDTYKSWSMPFNLVNVISIPLTEGSIRLLLIFFTLLECEECILQETFHHRDREKCGQFWTPSVWGIRHVGCTVPPELIISQWSRSVRTGRTWWGCNLSSLAQLTWGADSSLWLSHVSYGV